MTGFEYDKLGRLVKVIQDANGLALETTYGYDELGNRISQTDANLHATTFDYDDRGIRVSSTNKVEVDDDSDPATPPAAMNLSRSAVASCLLLESDSC